MAAAALAVMRNMTKARRKEKAEEDEREGRARPSSPTPAFPHEELLPHQARVHAFYRLNVVQIPIACAIVGNFLVIILEKEIDPYPVEIQRYAPTWFALDVVFNIIFLLELIVNMYGSWLRPFWKDGWNIFDFVVVLVGMLTMSGALQGGFKNLKILRPFRVFRLFKRIEALNKIVTALIRSIPGVMNAFLIMLIVMAIYAVLAVEYFATFGDSGFYNTTMPLEGSSPPYGTYELTEVSSLTVRQMSYGFEYYGTFMRALFTLFQVLTGESWAEAVARPLLFGKDDDSVDWWFAAVFFVSFILIMQVVLVNVVVAVLLDKFVAEEPAETPPEDAAPRAMALAATTDAGAAATEGAAPAAAAHSAPMTTPMSVPNAGGSTGDSGLHSAQPSSSRLATDVLRLQEQVSVMSAKLDGLLELRGRLESALADAAQHTRDGTPRMRAMGSTRAPAAASVLKA